MKNTGLIAIFLILLVNFSGFVAPAESNDGPIFTIRITDFQSPVKLGEFLEFSYFTRSVSSVNGAAEINFWIEKDGEIITSGSDTIYLGSSEEKTRTAEIFLPSNMKSDIYELKIDVNYREEVQKASRTVEINVEGDSATLNFGFGKSNIALISLLTLLAALNIYMIYRFEEKKIKGVLLKEEQFIKKHKVSFLTLSFFLILGALTYYLKLINFLPEIPLYFYYSILGILLLLVLFFSKKKNAK